MDRAIVLLSGGLDSAVTLWSCKASNWELYALTFNHYPLQHRKEVVAAKKLARRAGVIEHRIIRLPFLQELKDRPFPSDHPLAQYEVSLPPVYIPARNFIFYGIAVSWAEQVAARRIVGGHNCTDLNRFPDSSLKYFKSFNELIKVGTAIATRQPIEVLIPLSGMDKVGVIKLGLELKVPFELTWSCHERGELPCGHCTGCIERSEAFGRLGLSDPAGI